jgi:hypothetical protein
MQKLEKQLADGTSMEAMDAATAMIMITPGMKTFPTVAEITPAIGRRLSNVISAYRLIDILFALHSSTPTFQNPRYGKLPLQGLIPTGKVRFSTILSTSYKYSFLAMASGRLGSDIGGGAESYG